jgi:hypothetical protein
MSAAHIAVPLRGEHLSRWWRCCCPVQQSSSGTLALRDGLRGLVAHCHPGCSPEDILAEQLILSPQLLAPAVFITSDNGKHRGHPREARHVA